ncbi:hypothetical protein F511_15324 [Dorcoceras hygrometricum]|uniref:Uncharacterized protein n=1 Tax=Dorcoceras hygrometricum TaxID=472368 RepID=A0A2Z7B8B3_9LAMI|nr:hypothetical protein F511_15324 [Dorcoceras hygrometricum]
MAPFVPRTRAAAALRMKKIALDNQSRMIRRESNAIKERLEKKVSSLERYLQIQRCDNRSLRNTVNLCHEDTDRRISQLVEAKKEYKTNQVALEASHKTIAGLIKIGLKAEDMIQEKHLIIEALVEEKVNLLQTIQGLQEDKGDPAPFDDEWEKEPEEEGFEDIPMLIGIGPVVSRCAWSSHWNWLSVEFNSGRSVSVVAAIRVFSVAGASLAGGGSALLGLSLWQTACAKCNTEVKDPGLKDERVTPVYFKAGGARVTPVPHLPDGIVSRYGRSG